MRMQSVRIDKIYSLNQINFETLLLTLIGK